MKGDRAERDGSVEFRSLSVYQNAEAAGAKACAKAPARNKCFNPTFAAMRRASGSDFALISAARMNSPVGRFNSPLIRLLFRCSFRCCSAASVGNSSCKSMKQRRFSRRFSQKTAASDFFLPLKAEFGFPADPESVHGVPPRAGVRERACSKNTHMPSAARARHEGGGPDSVVFGGRLRPGANRPFRRRFCLPSRI